MVRTFVVVMQASEIMPRISRKSAVAEEILDGLNEVLDSLKGGRELRTETVPVSEVTAAREAMQMTQAEFAAAMNIPLPTIRKWERGSPPSGAAATLLKVIRKNPDAVRKALAA